MPDEHINSFAVEQASKLDALAARIRTALEAARVARSNALDRALDAGDALNMAQSCVSSGWKRWLRTNCFLLSERIQDMHDANFVGKKASQSQVHAWFVIHRDHYGPAIINPVSINKPTENMPWADTTALSDETMFELVPCRVI